jgi:hypothetical protein
VAHRFLGYLPPFRKSAGLRNCAAIPHLLGWFRWMCEQHPFPKFRPAGRAFTSR